MSQFIGEANLIGSKLLIILNQVFLNSLKNKCPILLTNNCVKLCVNQLLFLWDPNSVQLNFPTKNFSASTALWGNF